MKALIQPLKWHGGKHYLSRWIISLMPPHLHYVEPFFGGGSVLLARDPNRNWMAGHDPGKLPAALQGASEVVNDIHGELTNFWRVLQREADFQAFLRRAAMTPFSQIEFQQAQQACGDASIWSDRRASGCLPSRDPRLSDPRLDDPRLGDPRLGDDRGPDPRDDRVERAVQFFILARQSRQGLMRDFATLSRNRTRSRINEQVSAWLSVLDGLPDVHQRLQSVVILNDDACSVIRKQDGPLTLFYCDPPYLHETRSSVDNYHFEMAEQQHVELLETLSQIEGKFLLSGYPSDLYRQWQERCGWNRHEMQIDNKAASGKTKELKTECLWCNF